MEGSHTKKKANSVLKPSDLFTVNDENYTNWKLVLQTTKFFVASIFVTSLLRRSFPYSRLCPQFKYMTIICS